MVMPMPKLLDIVKLDTIATLPKAHVPYWVAAEEGIYLYNNTAIGHAILLQKKVKLPASFKSMGQYKDGYFHFSGPKIPRDIINLAYSFFKRVFEGKDFPNHKNGGCEAEVFILRNSQNTYSLFVPWQYTSHMGVNSIYDNKDIPEDATIIGTIHSHCDFDAFHSSTDTADASDFNGLHITIGHVHTDHPSFAAMVMINKEQFSYEINVVSEQDDDEVTVVDVPEEWFKFIYDDSEKLIDQYFPSLTKAELSDFVKECKGWNIVNNQAIIALGNSQYRGSWEDDDDWRNWRDWGTSGKGQSYGSYLQDTKFNSDFGRSLPRKWFKYPDAYGDHSLTEEGIEKALTDSLEKLFDIASKYGIYLEYELLNMYSVET